MMESQVGVPQMMQPDIMQQQQMMPPQMMQPQMMQPQMIEQNLGAPQMFDQQGNPQMFDQQGDPQMFDNQQVGEMGPQMPEHARTWGNGGLFGVKGHSKGNNFFLFIRWFF